MRIKDDSVEPKDCSVQLLLALMVADQVYKEFGADGVVITSLNDARHSETSLHYAGNAADIRVWNLPDSVDPNDVVTSIKARLNLDYDVIFESDHIHIEYQPRRRRP